MSGYGCVLNNKLLSERLCILIYSNNSSFNWMHTLYKEYILTFCNKDWLKRISYDINTDEYEDVVLLWSSFSHGLAFNKRTSLQFWWCNQKWIFTCVPSWWSVKIFQINRTVYHQVLIGVVLCWKILGTKIITFNKKQWRVLTWFILTIMF